MKKLSLLFMTMLLLVSGVIFSACGDKYKDLEIKANVEQVKLVLDDNLLSYNNDLVFEASGVKSWGELSIASEPSGLVKATYAVRGNKCYARIDALQPTGTGAKLVVTHLGSGKNIEIPLVIGRKLQTLEGANNLMIVSLHDVGVDGKEIELSATDLLIAEPSNYTDDIVWQIAEDGGEIEGVDVISYDDEDNRVVQPFKKDAGVSGDRLTGTSSAVKTVIKIDNDCENNSSITLNPISVLDKKAILHRNIQVTIQFMDVLTANDVVVTSSTHGRDIYYDKLLDEEIDDNKLVDLVLISNPDPDEPREDNKGYDYYSTALIDLKSKDEDGDLKVLKEINSDYQNLYNIKLSAKLKDDPEKNFDGLLLENIASDSDDFGKIRVIASNTCHGEGNIYIDFEPKDCVGDIKPFTLTIPCTVGERATGFAASRDRIAIDNIQKIDDKTFKSVDVPLNDSTSFGQLFKFEVLSTNTLDALSSYRISIARELLYINTKILTQDEDGNYYSPYIWNSDGTDKEALEVTKDEEGKAEEKIVAASLKDDESTGDEDESEICEYQISILKEGREIKFYYDQASNFVSEPLTSKNSIYMKWVRQSAGEESISEVDFGIKLISTYDEEQYKYDIKNHKFEDLEIEYDIAFNRQRTVESIEYSAVQIKYNASGWETDQGNSGKDWQFYLQNNMMNGHEIGGNTYYYGIQITNVLGLGGSSLSTDELKAINVEIKVNAINLQEDDKNALGLAEFTREYIKGEKYSSSYRFNYGGSGRESEHENIIVFGIATYYKVESKPSNWEENYTDYYIYDDGEYISVTGNDVPNFEGADYYKYVLFNNTSCGDYELTFSQNGRVFENATRKIKIYEQLTNEDITISLPNADFSGQGFLTDTYTRLLSKPINWETNYTDYYTLSGGVYTKIPAGAEAPEYNVSDYYQLDDIGAINLDTTYILATNKTYDVNIEIEDEEFFSIASTNVTAESVEGGVTSSGDVYANKLPGTNATDKHIITTGAHGSFNTTTNRRKYVKLTYKFTPIAYSYDRQSGAGDPCEKTIYIYVYEPLTSAYFYDTNPLQAVTNLEKYDYDKIINQEFKSIHGKHTLNINLNNNSKTIANYVDIEWQNGGDGIVAAGSQIGKLTSTYQFSTNNMPYDISRNIEVLITQFGIQYPITCSVIVKNPVLTDRVELNNDIRYLEAGTPFINLNKGSRLQINPIAYAKDENSEISMPGFEYIVCSSGGYKLTGEGNTQVSSSGQLQALKAGRYKLIVVAKDRVIDNIDSVINYLNFTQYIDSTGVSEGHKPYVVVDVLVADGSEGNPYLISTAEDFKNINNITTEGENYLHFALINNIDLAGEGITINDFKGVISSYRQNDDSARFTIRGIMLTESNPTLFSKLALRADYKPNLQNVDFMVDINYKSTEAKGDVKIGLVGENAGVIYNCSVQVSGTINANSIANTYTTGGMVSLNSNVIHIDDSKLVGVEGNITVTNGSRAKVILGGVVGQNNGVILGALPQTLGTPDSEIMYEVSYDNQGATADVDLRVHSVGNLTDSAVGGVVGYNNGTATTINYDINKDGTNENYYQGAVINVYSMGKVSGQNSAGTLSVNNIGGLIGKNTNTGNYISATLTKGRPDINNEDFETLTSITLTPGTNQFQIQNSYSSAQVIGNNNVGGAVGYDQYGTYQKVYYEVYSAQNAVVGNNNIGGLIGSADDTTLQYCYANSFAWNYQIEVDVYDIKGNNNIGGLIGYAKSSNTTFATSNKMNVVSGLASVAIDGTKVGGLIGLLEGYGAIYHAYFYGIIKNYVVNNVNYTALAKFEGGNPDLPYYSAYAIVANYSGDNQLNPIASPVIVPDANAGFSQDTSINNGKPYIIDCGVYEDTGELKNIVSQIPISIQIDKSFELYFNEDKKLYEENANGEYVEVREGVYERYNINDENHEGKTRYTVRAHLEDTTDTSGDESDYRAKALILYYYQFTDLTGENALTDMYALNTLDMHHIVDDNGIVVIPNTWKRFNVRSSNSNIVRVLDGGKLLLRNEGQVVITIVSQLNPSATASFVVIVRSKVLKFGLYSSADTRSENLEGKTITIVNGSSKIIYADYSGDITRYGNKYEYKQATNMKVGLTITIGEGELKTGEEITDYITINDMVAGTNFVLVPNDEPITINIHKHFAGTFKITAKPYVIATYTNGAYSYTIEKELEDHYKTSFTVTTRKGATAINTDKTLVEMMPADEAVNLGVKVSTDIQVNTIKVTGEVLGDFEETINGTKINALQMLDIIYKGTKEFTLDASKIKGTIALDISSEDLVNEIQAFGIKIKLNKNAYYSTLPFKIQITLSVEDESGKVIVSTIFHININYQRIINIMPLNYRMEEDSVIPDLDEAYETKVIRPGSTNIITVDINPSIAVYDYVEIQDTTIQDKILFQQVKPDLSSMDNMDIWTDGGIRLKKYEYKTSKLYLLAKLPLDSTANIEHNLLITVYDKDGEAIISEPLVLQAIMYPTVVMTYTYPNGVSKEVNTSLGNNQREAVNTETIYLATGVEAGISIQTINIDDNSLAYNVKIMDGDTEITNNQHITFAYENGQYLLRFNPNKRIELLGKTISINFTAYKKLNGVTESCSATMTFTIVSMVVHGVSMTHSLSTGDIYGHWGEEFKTQFYFDKQDISYYNNGYWNVQYRLDNISEDLGGDFGAIRDLLENLNSIGSDVTVKFGEEEIIANETYKQTETYEITKPDNTKEEITVDVVEFTHSTDNMGFNIVAREGKENVGENHLIHKTNLTVEFNVKYQNYYPIITSDDDIKFNEEFSFDISQKTELLGPYKQVTSQQKFEDMIEGDRYEIPKDVEIIEFYNYVPIDTAIAELNGNGATIRIRSFNMDQLVQNYTTGNMKIGLFGTLAENTIIRNLKIEYKDKNDRTIRLNFDEYITTDEQVVNDIHFGAVASENNGIITNVFTSGQVKIVSSKIKADKIIVGGISAINGANTSTLVATITNSTSDIEMDALAIIGGVSVENYGKIVNTNFTGKITVNSNEQDKDYVSNINTAGFVVENSSVGYISLSYVKSDKSNTGDINSVGSVAGFVYNNSGTIDNCYTTNIKLVSQGNISGFVYQTSGTVTNSYSYADVGQSRFYEQFIFITTNVGTINNCYFISDATKINKVSGLNQISTDNANNQEKYDFIFGDYALWTMGLASPEIKDAGYTDEFSEIYNIYDLETYDVYFTDGIDETRVIDADRHFRIVRDLDFEYVETNPSTADTTLKTWIEGNDMAIKNYRINNTGKLQQVGLFGLIDGSGVGENIVFVRNLILQPTEIKASNTNAVGALAGIIVDSYIYNIKVDSQNLLILGKNAVGGLAGVIKGSFDVNGISSNISSFATYSYTSSSQYNLYKSHYVDKGIDNISEVSYAGAVAGIVDGYIRNTNPPLDNRELIYYRKISHITIADSIVLIAETVGGAFGFVGEYTSIDKMNYNLTETSKYQGVYVSGGLVGENRGAILNSNIYATKVENGAVVDINTKDTFNNFARVNGCIVGLNIGGLIYKCSSDITVSTNANMSTVGGIVGRNIEGSIISCSVSSNLDGYFVGGIAGTDYNYDTIIAVNLQYGSATTQTKAVYNTIKNRVTYTGLSDYGDALSGYKNNVLTYKFISTFASKVNSYYSINSDYITGSDENMINCSKVFGLIIGLTSVDYITQTEDAGKTFKDVAVTYENKNLTVTLSAGSTSEVKEYEAKDGKTSVYKITPIQNVEIKDISYANDDNTIIAYIIAHKGTYEYWTTSSGYTDHYIAFSPKVLEEWT